MVWWQGQLPGCRQNRSKRETGTRVIPRLSTLGLCSGFLEQAQTLKLHVKSEAETRGLPGCLSGKESACQCKRSRRHRFDPWVRKVPWRSKWQPTTVFLPGQESHGQRSLVGYSPWSCKRVRRDQVTEQQQCPPLVPTEHYSQRNMLIAQCSCLKMHNWPLFFLFPFILPFPLLFQFRIFSGFYFPSISSHFYINAPRVFFNIFNFKTC